jgi:endogenous inhibitor of DNA gyrase (YacG/DUF329 family)
VSETTREDQVEKTGSKITKKTFAEHGATLPLGVLNGNELSKEFEVRDWTMKEDRAVGALRDKAGELGVGRFIAEFISKMCLRVGPHDFENMKDAEKILVVNQMFLGDVFYIYVWLRVEALGADLPLEIQCPKCKAPISMKADLNTLDVKSADELGHVRWNYDLKKPFKIRTGDAKTLLMGPPRWSALSGLKGQMNLGLARFSAVKGAIWGVEGQGDFAIADHEIDEMRKIDIEGIQNSSDEHFIGAEMAVDVECPECGKTSLVSLDWSFDTFFSTSSQ